MKSHLMNPRNWVQIKHREGMFLNFEGVLFPNFVRKHFVFF